MSDSIFRQHTGVGCLATAMAFSLAIVQFAGAEDAPVRIRPGAVELGLSGSVISVEGNTRVGLAVLAGSFVSLGPGLGGLEAELAYSHVSSLDILDVEGHLSWQFPISGSTLYPFVDIGGGFRQEWIGSFKQTFYPVGVDLGFRVLAGEHIAIRTQYRFRRILDAEVSDFSEHEVRMGLSLFLNNNP